MNFDLTEDEQMLKAVAERFLDNQYAGEERREYQSQPCGFEPRNWALLGELGILAASYPEEAGGLDLGATSISLIHHAMGRGLAVEPLIDCALLAGGILVRAQDEIAGQWADDLASGAKRAALAHNEFDAPGGWSGLRTQARKVGDTVQITGTKPFTMGGCGADLYLVSALDDDAADGGALYLVAADADGLDVETWRVADGSMAVMLRLTDVRPIARIENGARLLAQAGHPPAPELDNGAVRSGSWSACSNTRSTTYASASSSTSRSAGFRRSSIAWPRCTPSSNRPSRCSTSRS